MNSKKILKTPKGTLLTAIIFIVLAVLMISVGMVLDTPRENENCEDYNSLIASKSDTENKYVKVTMADLPYQFAVQENGSITNTYYIIFDENNLMYIVRLSDDTFAKLEEMYNQNPDEFSYELKGYIFNAPDELKKLAMETFNESSQAEQITNENYSDYFGQTYLDEKNTPNTPIASTIITIGAVLGILSIILFIVYIFIAIKVSKMLRKYNKQELEEELLKNTTVSYPMAKIYLTDKYIISKASGLDIMTYDELYWIYIETRRYNGFSVGKYLIAKMKNKKSKQIAVVHKSEEMLMEIMEKIHKKNKEVLTGFTQENQKAFKELKNN